MNAERGFCERRGILFRKAREGIKREKRKGGKGKGRIKELRVWDPGPGD